MMSRYELVNSDNLYILNCLELDRITITVMKSLNLKCFRSLKNRTKDRRKAIEKYGDLPEFNEYRVHHMMNGLVGLCPKDFHSLPHYGYFYRLRN